MSVKKKLLAVAAISGAVLALPMTGTAFAQDGYTRICVVATNDRNNPGESPVCVWVPVEPPMGDTSCATFFSPEICDLV